MDATPAEQQVPAQNLEIGLEITNLRHLKRKGKPQVYKPHCQSCSNRQGYELGIGKKKAVEKNIMETTDFLARLDKQCAGI